MTELKKEIEMVNNLGTTENGAVGYKSTHNDLVDLNFRISSMRRGLSNQDIDQFINSLKNDLEYTIKWLFFVRDIRGGLGERDTFVRLYQSYYLTFPEHALNTLSLISEYGRWGDVVDLAFLCGEDTLKFSCFKLIEEQLREDTINVTHSKPISLLSKWLPSINASKNARKRAIEFIKYLGMTNGSYRKMLSKLRSYLDVTEVKTCANKWSEIDYNKVSSNANLRYNDSFIKHDKERRQEYLENLKSNKEGVKMNTSNLYPHEIWHKYIPKYNYYTVNDEDEGLEMMWKNLGSLENCGNTMCVCDGSGSMITSIPNTSVRAIDVSRSLSVYFAERCTGEFYNHIIEFSHNPKFIDLNPYITLHDKIGYMNNFNDCSNTDIEKVFGMILSTALKYNISQENMPERILIISDMEFDYSTTNGCGKDMVPLFEKIKNGYEKEGYKLPKLVFWNVCSRNKIIPITSNEAGVTLISGFSTNLLKMVMSNETDPWCILKETLDSERYNIVGDKLKQETHV